MLIKYGLLEYFDHILQTRSDTHLEHDDRVL